MRFTIRIKVLIGFTFLLLLSSFIQAFSFNITRNYITSQNNNSQSTKAKEGAGEIQNYFTNLNETNYGLARIYRENINMASSSGQNTIASVSEYIVDNNDQIRIITYLSQTGRELYKFDVQGQVHQEQLNYEVFTDAFKNAASGKTSISKVYYLERELGPHIDIFSPIFNSNHSVMAVIKMQINLETLRKNIEKIKYGQNGFMYVVDDEGRLIAHPSQHYVFERPNLTSREIIAHTLSNKTDFDQDSLYKNEKNIEVIAKAEKVPGINWVAVIEQPVSEAYGFLDFIRNIFIVTLIGATIVLLLVALVLSENFTSPIRKLQKSVDLIENGQMDTSTIVKSGDEIESLSRSFNSLVNQLIQREKSIKKENQEMTTLLQSLSDAVVSLDSDNRILVFNKAAEKITGLLSHEVIGLNVDNALQFYDKDTRVLFVNYNNQSDAMIQKLREKGLLIKNVKGDVISVSMTISPIFLEEQQSGFIIAFHDTTKEHELEEMKLDFVSMAAHELRTPLTAIRGYISIFQMQYSKNLDGPAQEIIRRLIISGENLGNLIDNLLSVSRIERNIFNIQPKPVNLTNLIKTVAETMQHQLATRQQHLIVNISKDLPLVMADIFRINQVLINLLSNASNYSKNESTITINARKINDNLEIFVADEGEGIPKEALPKLFIKFFRVQGSLEQGSKGTGLGLFISKSIIDMHKGKIWVESEYGKGSTFIFSLPIATQEEITNFLEKTKNTNLTVKSGSSIIIRK